MSVKIKSNPPIFIVGFPRSGTTLLTAMLSNHPDIASGPETHFFSKLKDEDFFEAINDPDWPKIASKQISNLTIAGQSVLKLFGQSEKGYFDSLKNRPISVASMLNCLMEISMLRDGKVRWLEKTPGHLLYLHRLRREYPNAQIIHIIRDPRDSVRSTVQLPWAPKSKLAIALEFRKRIDYANIFFKDDNNWISVKYEDLVQNPEEMLTSVCDYLNIKYSKVMLDTTSSGKKISSAGEPWKKEVSGKLNSNRLNVWKREMEANEAAMITSVLFDFIDTNDYDNLGLHKLGNVFCSGMTLTNMSLNEHVLGDLIDTGFIPVPISFNDLIREKSGVYLKGQKFDVSKKMLLRMFNLLPIYNFRIV